MQRRSFTLILIALPIAVVCLWVAWRFNADVAQASARAMRGGVTVQTRCGPIEYEAAGEGVPLLMIHGSGGGHDQGMAFGAPFTREGVRVIAVSRFGYLGTPLPADASPEAQGDAHACLLDALGIRQAAVLGASAGALSALQLAIRHPQRVVALVLVVPITYNPTAQTAPTLSPLAERALMWLIGSDFVYWSALHIARDPLIQRVLATPPHLVASASPAEHSRVDAMLQSILPVSARADGLRNETRVIKNLQPHDLTAIRAPTLLISARDDGYGTYANAEYTAARIAGASSSASSRAGTSGSATTPKCGVQCWITCLRTRGNDVLELHDPSSIVKTFSMQTLTDIASQDAELRGPIVAQQERLTRCGTPAMKSRGRNLLTRLRRPRPGLSCAGKTTQETTRCS